MIYIANYGSPLSLTGFNNQILYDNNGVVGGISNGTAGQVLTSNGAGSPPSFQTAGGGSGLTVGTTTITGGTTTRILYNNGSVLGEYTLTGTGTVVAMQTSPTLTTPVAIATTTSPGISFTWKMSDTTSIGAVGEIYGSVGALFLGSASSSPTNKNYALSGNNSGVTVLNVGSGGFLSLAIDDSTKWKVTTTELSPNSNATYNIGTSTVAVATTYTNAFISAVGTVLSGSSAAPAQITTAQTGINVTLTSSNAVAGSSVAGAANGGDIVLTTGNGARLTSGDGSGGNVKLVLGTAVGNGNSGQVLVTGNNSTNNPQFGTIGAASKGFGMDIGMNNDGFCVYSSGQQIGAIYGGGTRGFYARSDGGFLWNNTTGFSSISADTGMFRNAAGIVEINNGTSATYRDIKIRNVLAGGGNGSYIQTPSMTVANLASAATAGMGARAFVTDATNTIIVGLGLTVVGGGANKVPVYSDGTNWIVG